MPRTVPCGQRRGQAPQSSHHTLWGSLARHSPRVSRCPACPVRLSMLEEAACQLRVGIPLPRSTCRSCCPCTPQARQTSTSSVACTPRQRWTGRRGATFRSWWRQRRRPRTAAACAWATTRGGRRQPPRLRWVASAASVAFERRGCRLRGRLPLWRDGCTARHQQACPAWLQPDQQRCTPCGCQLRHLRPSETVGVPTLQGETVRLGNAHAALLEAQGASWAEALAEGTRWRLVQVLTPRAA